MIRNESATLSDDEVESKKKEIEQKLIQEKKSENNKAYKFEKDNCLMF